MKPTHTDNNNMLYIYYVSCTCSMFHFLGNVRYPLHEYTMKSHFNAQGFI